MPEAPRLVERGGYPAGPGALLPPDLLSNLSALLALRALLLPPVTGTAEHPA